MTIQMVVYTEIIFAITVVFLEVPTGIIADRWGRKKMIVLSAVLECFMFLILVFAAQFWHFAAAIFLAGIARSASSGSENALLYDSLLENGKEQDFEKYLGRLNVCDFTAAILAALCGSVLANRFGFEFNYWLSFFSMFAAVSVSFMLVEPAIKNKFDGAIEIKEYMKTSLVFFKQNSDVSLVVLTGMVLGAALSFIDEFWQLYLNRLEIPVFYFGAFSAVIMILRLPGNLIAHVIKGRFRYKSILLGVTAVFAGGFIYLSVTQNLTGLAAIFLICFFSGILEPVTTGYLHHRIDSKMRATIDSFQSLGLNTVLIITGLGFGYFSSKLDIFGGFGFIGFMCCIFFVCFLISSKRIVE
jgi:MFS family permease